MTTEQIPFSIAGELVANLGTEQFPARLWSWLHSTVEPQSYHIAALRFRRPALMSPVENLDVLFFAGHSDPDESRLALSLYQREDEWKRDEQLLNHVERATDPQLILSHHQALPPTDYGRLIAQSPLGEECTLIGSERDHVYTLSIFRRRDAPSFTLGELGRLRQLCSFLFPLLAQHARLSATAVSGSSDVLLQYLDRSLSRARISLSPRERLVCHAAMEGITVPQIAERLAIGQCSVRTYLDRALNKIGVGSKSELFAWCVAVSETQTTH
ncbi:helix-turn-helix transcriptional regulator [Vogesella sp. LIG4]|uniref:helix-turn-helix transcriptional regulator n=1 Tax=Vogesella sp. LIG4 TaxID=1192162 RepID=UPI00081FD7AE|nr:helix-turn-helix transcriptional regulator [Vogesella sp. LIG4]SCK30071.1 Response regulator containing a CheY-like receiver domain and an HTH DNA-binding domain [Vogesella sp. LIG4]